MNGKRAFAVVLAFCLGAAAWAELELGMGLTPIPGDDSSQDQSQGGLWENSFKTFHAGLRTGGIFYFSADLVVVPPFIAEGMTSYYDEGSGRWISGIYRPAVISVYDAGLKFKIGSFSFSLQGGINQFYVYKQAELEGFKPPDIGANLKVGLGLRLVKFLGFEVSAISVQPSLKDAVRTIGDAFSDDELLREDAIDKLTKQIVPTIQLVLYL